MRTLVYAMQASLDGHIESPNGDLDWNRIDEEIHRHFNEQEDATDLVLYGRRLYELMAGYWPTADEDASLPDYVREYSAIWRGKRKVVFSKTLERVEWNSELISGDAVATVRRLKEDGEGTMSVGGATLAASLIEHDLIDEYWVYVTPVILGGGKPMFPPAGPLHRLELVEQRRFGSGVVLLRYRRERLA